MKNFYLRNKVLWFGVFIKYIKKKLRIYPFYYFSIKSFKINKKNFY